MRRLHNTCVANNAVQRTARAWPRRKEVLQHIFYLCEVQWEPLLPLTADVGFDESMNFVECIVREYSDLSKQDLQRHIRFCSRVLAADSSADVVLSNAGRIPIWKRKFKTKPDCLELQISAGHLGRPVVENAAAELEAKGINFRSRFTKKRGALSRIITLHEISDIFTLKVITEIIASVGKIVDPNIETFSMEYWSKFEEECEIEDGDPVTFDSVSKLGYSIGHALGVVAKLIKH